MEKKPITRTEIQIWARNLLKDANAAAKKGREKNDFIGNTAFHLGYLKGGLEHIAKNPSHIKEAASWHKRKLKEVV